MYNIKPCTIWLVQLEMVLGYIPTGGIFHAKRKVLLGIHGDGSVPPSNILIIFEVWLHALVSPLTPGGHAF